VTAARPFEVKLSVGTLYYDGFTPVHPPTWTVVDDQPVVLADDDDTALAVPMTLNRALSSELWPADEVAPILSFTIVGGSYAAVARILKGATVRLRFTAGATTGADLETRRIYFDGRVTDLSLRPLRVGAVGGGTRPAVALDVIAVGYRADLDAAYVEGTVVQQTSERRVDDLFELAGLEPPAVAENEVETGSTIRGEVTIQNGRLGAELDRILNSWAVRPGDLGPFWIDPRGRARYVIRPRVTIDLLTNYRELQGWDLEPRWPTVDPVLAATLSLVGGVWSVTPSTSSAVANDPVIDADHIDRGSIRFAQRSGANVNTVTVDYIPTTGQQATVSEWNGEMPRVRVEITETLIRDADGSEADEVAALYLPPAGAPAWLIESLTWRLDTDTPGRVPPEPGSAVVVGPLDARHNPNGREWFTGIVGGWTLTIGPKPEAAIDLRPPHFRLRSAAAGALTWAAVPAGATWATLNPRDTWDDYRLLKP
jgi:hypothetical protein